MKPIDLKAYASDERKIPIQFLNETRKTEAPKLWKTLSVHYIDLMICLTFASTMTGLFNHSVKTLMVTKDLRFAFAGLASKGLLPNLLPMVILSYFFLIYFMNHGQSLGMMVFKKRVEMKHNDFKDSFSWGLSSLFICISGGLVFFNPTFKARWDSMKGHDYLYQNLLDNDYEVPQKIQVRESNPSEFETNKAA